MPTVRQSTRTARESRRALGDVSNKRQTRSSKEKEQVLTNKRSTRAATIAAKQDAKIKQNSAEPDVVDEKLSATTTNSRRTTRSAASLVSDVEMAQSKTTSRKNSNLGNQSNRTNSRAKESSEVTIVDLTKDTIEKPKTRARSASNEDVSVPEPKTRITRAKLTDNSDRRITRAAANSNPQTTQIITEAPSKKRTLDEAEEIQPRRKIARNASKTKGNEKKRAVNNKKRPRGAANKKTTQKPKPREANICSDFLPHSDYNLVQVPFDSSKYTLGLAPHDQITQGDVLMVPEYVTDLFQRLYNEESHTHPELYMHKQPKLNGTMRAILIDWLVEVHMKFRLVPETLYLCVNIIDRYLSLVKVERHKLQLVGVTSLLIACKYEEIYPPEVRDCVYITDRAYTRQEVLDMEKDIVQTLKFRMTVPTGYAFLQRFLFVMNATKTMKIAANYYMERILQEYNFLEYRPSLVAASVVCLAINHPGIRRHDELHDEFPGVHATLTKYTGYDQSEILNVAAKICEKVGEEVVTMSRRELHAVKRKYESSRFKFVSMEFSPPQINHILHVDSNE